MIMKFNFSNYLLIFLLTFQSLISQNSSEIYSKLEKLNVLGSLLHVGAHPDDENTNLISYFSNKYNVETTYLSLTRGDGGQNLIGSELKDELGVIRTQELIAARKVDGANQLFTSAKDFGYSRNPEETLRIWNKKKLLDEIVSHIRTIQPDIIINRFDHRTSGRTHGHHTSSAILSDKAFDLAANKNEFRDQLNSLSTWEPKRLFLNVSWFFYGSQDNFSRVNKKDFIKFDYSEYNTLRGKTYEEISAESRSQHKSQGFGRSANPGGPKWGYLELIKGKNIDSNNPFEGIDISWNRIKGGKKIDELIKNLLNNFDFKTPEKNVSALINIYNNIEKLDDSYWKNKKINDLKEIIIECLGLNIQLNSKNMLGTPNNSETFNLKIVNPSNVDVLIKNIKTNERNIPINLILSNNNLLEKKVKINTNDRITTPYWLTSEGDLGMFNVKNDENNGLPETQPSISANINIEINGSQINLIKYPFYRFTDPINGEVIIPFTIVPKMTLNLDQQVYIFYNSEPKQIFVSVNAHAEKIEGNLTLKIPDGWEIDPENHKINLDKKGEQKTYVFNVSAKNKNSGIIKPIVEIENQSYSNSLIEIDYPHITKQFIVKPSYAKANGIDLKNNVYRVGYIMGAGDKIPKTLENIGVDVVEIEPSQIKFENIKYLKTIILGIRSFNVIDELRSKNRVLWEYVKNGGTLIIQYNTTRGLKTNEIAPYKLKLSRDRVTDENSKFKILNKSHPIFNYPNKIENYDFNNWVQERGLYFPSSWSDKFEPHIEFSDYDQIITKGGLLSASYGNGKIIYTGLSFFRQLPAGVSGAYRLFINLINYGHQDD